MTDVSPIAIVSSDGHATARMPDYRPYLHQAFHAEFDAFVGEYARLGSRTVDAKSLLQRTDDAIVQQWQEEMLESGRIEGYHDPDRRLKELDAEGIAAEVIFPDFNIPFVMFSPHLAATLGAPVPSPVQLTAAYSAYNRWVADFCTVAPERFGAMALVDFDDVDAAIAEVTWAKDAGFRGVVLPTFRDDAPLFDARFDPLWHALSDLELPVNCHVALTGVTAPAMGPPSSLPHPTAGFPIFSASLFFVVRQVLAHMIWGGVLERHPRLQVVFTETGSGWVVPELSQLDYTYEGSYLRQDIRDVIPLRPSEYFERQCHIGSSILSRAEVESRHTIGVHKMMVGIDYPHHEGAWNGGTLNYLRATLGAAGVPEGEARRMLGLTAIGVFGFDAGQVTAVAAEVGPSPAEILVPGDVDAFPRGDVRKPLVSISG